MAITQDSGDGVVVLMYGGGGSQAMRAIAAKVLGRNGCWQLARAAD